MSKLVWDKLTPDQQTAVSHAATESAALVKRESQAYEQQAYRLATEGGMNVTHISLPADRQPFVMAVEPLYKQFLVNPRLQDLRRRIRSTTKN